MRETKGVMYSAQCGKFTGCGVGAKPLPQEASSGLSRVLQPGTLTAGVLTLCSYLHIMPVVSNQTDLDLNHTEDLLLIYFFFPSENSSRLC